MTLEKEQLKNLLVDNGFCTLKDFELAEEIAHEEGETIESVLIDKDILSDEYLGELIAAEYDLQFISLEKHGIETTALRVIPEGVARKNRAIAFSSKEKIKLGMSNPNDLAFINLIERKTSKEVTPFYVTDRDLETAFDMYSLDLSQKYNDLITEQVEEAGKGKIKEYPIIQIVDILIEYAFNNKASDLHIEPRKEYINVRFRIDGVLHSVLRIPVELHDSIVARIKVLAKLRTDDHFSAQDGKINREINGKEIDIRVSIMPITSGEKVVLRLLSESMKDFSLYTIGLERKELDIIKDGIQKPWGLILATGPTGSGKTTTLYTLLKLINNPSINISAIEDPVEYDIQNINQIQVNARTGLTFAKGLRSIVRQDPDVIMVGEIRDEETAGIAVNSAMTGHLVLSSLHTNNAATTMPRLLDMGIEPYLVASTMNIAVAQRLVRKICFKCRKSIKISKEKTKQIVDQFNPRIQEILKKKYIHNGNLSVYEGQGCSNCQHSGYSGRVGIFEILKTSEKIQSLIIARKNSQVIEDAAIKEGMITMVEDGLIKMSQGITTIEEILRVTKTK